MDTAHFLSRRAGCVTKSIGDRAGLQTFRFHFFKLPVGEVASEFHRHLCQEKCVYISGGNGLPRIGPNTFQLKAGDRIGYLAGGEAHHLRNTGSLHMSCVIVGQKLVFDVVDYPEQKKMMCRHAGQPVHLVDIVAVSYLRLVDV